MNTNRLGCTCGPEQRPARPAATARAGSSSRRAGSGESTRSVSQPEATVPTMSKMPISASSEADVVAGMPWSCAAGMKWVPIRPLVDQPQIQKVRNSAQKVQLRLTSRSVRHGDPARRPDRPRSTAARRTTPARRSGSCADVGGTVAQHQQDHRHEQQRERRPPGPAAQRQPGSVGQLGDHRQEDQLAGRAGRREQPGDEAAVPDEPAVGDDRAEDQRHRAGAHPDRQPPEQPQLPGRGHHQGQAGADGDQGERRPPATRRRPNRSISAAANGAVEPVDHQVERDRARGGRPRPAELLLQRLEQHPGRGPEAGRRHERGHRHPRHPPRAARAPSRAGSGGGDGHRSTLGTALPRRCPRTCRGASRSGQQADRIPATGYPRTRPRRTVEE